MEEINFMIQAPDLTPGLKSAATLCSPVNVFFLLIFYH